MACSHKYGLFKAVSPGSRGRTSKIARRLVYLVLFAFFRVLARSIFVDQSFQLGAIQRGKGAA